MKTPMIPMSELMSPKEMPIARSAETERKLARDLENEREMVQG